VSAAAYLPEIVALLLGGTVVAFIAFSFGIVPIVGFLLAGIVIGPGGLGIVSDPVVVEAAAEIGVILLLFTIGIQFSLGQLARIQRVIFGGGGLQVALATGVTAGVAMALGVAWQAALFTGLLVALTSSTAIILKLLADRHEMDSEQGQAALGLLIFQDLATVAAFFLVPILAGQGGTAADVGVAVLKAAGVVVAVLVLARRLMPPVLERVARTCSPEIFLLAIVSICFGTAWVTSLMGLSLSLGAFLAGLIVSESEFSQHAMMEILPLQILFSATFFVSVGMLVDVSFLFSNLPVILAVVVAVVVVKTVTTGVAVRGLGYAGPVSLMVGVLLSQVGEFGFVLLQAGSAVGLTPGGAGEDGVRIFTASSVLLMVATPFLAKGGGVLAARWELRRREQGQGPGADPDAMQVEGDGAGGGLPALEDHVIVAGYGAGARRLVPLLQRGGVPFVVATLSPDGAREAAAAGGAVLRGDYGRPALLRELGVERAAALLLLDDPPVRAGQVAAVASMERRDLPIFVRTRHGVEIPALEASGASVVVAEELEGLVGVCSGLARSLGMADAQVADLAEALRRDALAGPAPPPVAVTAAATVSDPPSDPMERTVAPSWSPPRPVPLDMEASVELVPDPRTSGGCSHLESIRVVSPSAPGCEECLATGDRWVHLRICMSCGHVGCCDSSKNRHATRHHEDTRHPIARSMEPGETWGWCFVDRTQL